MIGSQQEILVTKTISYLLNLSNHLTDYNFTFIPWYSLSSWVNKHEIKEVNKKVVVTLLKHSQLTKT
jgi:hypothetical protein